MRFLIIDDSPLDAHALTSFLEMLGHQVDCCESPIDALNTIEHGNYDTVFLDVVMPDQDGYKFLRTLRLNPATSDRYVVLCSNKNSTIEMNYGINRAGANDYLPKPVSRESVEKIIEKIPA